MKLWVLSIAALAAGAALGVGLTASDLADDVAFLPNLEAASSIGPQPHAPPPGARPRVEVVGSAEHDFGVMEKDQTRSHTFVFKNVGNAPLKLSKLDTTCKCTLSELAKDLLAPGETADVTLEWTAKSFAREFRQRARIKTTDPDRSVVELTIFGRVTQSVRATPEDMVFSNISASEARSADVRVFCYRDRPLKLEFERFVFPDTADYFDVQIQPLSQELIAAEPGAKSGALVTVTVKPGLPLGPIRQTVYFRTNLEETQLGLPVGGSVSGDISIVAPRQRFNKQKNILLVGGIPGSEGGRYPMHLLVKGPHAAKLKLEVGEVDPADVLQVTLDTANPSRINDGAVLLYPLLVEIPAGSRVVNRLGGAVDGVETRLGRIVIETDHPETRQVLIYVRFAVEG